MKNLNSQAGFNLIELLTAMVVFALIAGLALPSFNSLLQDNRLTSSTNSFATAVNLARSEAVSRNARVVLCIVANDGTNCEWGVETWEDGWVLFQDRDSNGDVDQGEAIRYFEALPDQQTFVKENAAGNDDGPIIFLPNGQIRNGEFEMELCSSNADEGRTVFVSSMGRVSVEVIPPC